MTEKEILDGNKLIAAKFQGDFPFISSYNTSWDLLHIIIDIINAKGKAYNFIIFKNYIALTVEKDSKFFKDFHFAHSEYITSEQDGKTAAYKLILKFIKWDNENKLGKNLVD